MARSRRGYTKIDTLGVRIRALRLASTKPKRGALSSAAASYSAFSEEITVAISRRKFVRVGVAAAAGVTLNRKARADVLEASSYGSSSSDFAAPPVVVASANWIRGVARTYDMIFR